MDDGLTEDDSIVPINTLTPSQEHEFVQTMDNYIQLFIHVVTLHTVCINVIYCNYDSEHSSPNIVLDIVHQL